MKLPNGFSYIDHSRRVRLDLTLPEYVLADFFEQCERNNVVPSYDAALSSIGLSHPSIYESLLAQLQIKGIVIAENGKVNMTPTWGMVTKKDEQFEEIWAILRKKGYKEKARKNFTKAVRISKFEVIREAAKIHVKNTPDETFQMAGHNFLDPSNKVWLDQTEKHSETAVKPAIIAPTGKKETR